LSRLHRVSYALSGATISDASPSSSSHWQHHHDLACASASCARDRHACANQSPSAKHYELDPSSFARPADRRSLDMPTSVHAACMSAPVFWSSASLEVFRPLQRSLAALALSGAAGLRTIPLRRFHPQVGPRVLSATCRRDGFTFALAVFRSSGFVAMKLTWRTRGVAERSNRIRRSRGAGEPNGLRFRVRVGG